MKTNWCDLSFFPHLPTILAQKQNSSSTAAIFLDFLSGFTRFSFSSLPFPPFSHNFGVLRLLFKGCLFSESFSLWLPWALSTEDALGSDLTPFFGDLRQSENLSEIKPPLIHIGFLVKFFLKSSCQNYFSAQVLFYATWDNKKNHRFASSF